MPSSRVLFVDDNLLFSWGAREFLEESGFTVESVYSGVIACAAIDRPEPLLALATDIDLGPGPTGFDVARYARAKHPNLPVVYMSGYDQPDYAEQRVAGSEFLAKPFPPRQIADALQRVIRFEAAEPDRRRDLGAG
jgi:CheY-like chemotaxis protein